MTEKWKETSACSAVQPAGTLSLAQSARVSYYPKRPSVDQLASNVGDFAHTADPLSHAIMSSHGQPGLCPGCNNHESLSMPWINLPEKVASDIERFCDQLNSLWCKNIIDKTLYNKLYEHSANRYPPTFCTIETLGHCPPLWMNYHNVKTNGAFHQIGCIRCRKMTPQLWI